MAILSFSFQAAQGVRAFTWRGRSVAGGMCGLVHGFWGREMHRCCSGQRDSVRGTAVILGGCVLIWDSCSLELKTDTGRVI